MEFGPRALGARSILGDPRNIQMQSVMNLKIKHRESFRPFAPAVLGERDLEFGPRALGARSILGDPRNIQMQSVMNLKIKHRESFRPFAPAVLAERVAEYFDLDRESPYMLLVAPVREERCPPLPEGTADNHGDDMLPMINTARSDLPAITHVDYSARVQTIH